MKRNCQDKGISYTTRVKRLADSLSPSCSFYCNTKKENPRTSTTGSSKAPPYILVFPVSVRLLTCCPLLDMSTPLPHSRPHLRTPAPSHNTREVTFPHQPSRDAIPRASPSTCRYVTRQKSWLINFHEENCLREGGRRVPGGGVRAGGCERECERGRVGGGGLTSMGTLLQGHICNLAESSLHAL
ncbi:hypothetical protein E2C01_065019 [Portunus trituberculatus]|uniref:Uncharacterized protein n=1 Tax=Portunus trituberculatus TaxID=210409 RepID=A0A5B7HHR6_PORTR|nr:hypothetical protein [Portunus trituberculatus]